MRSRHLPRQGGGGGWPRRDRRGTAWGDDGEFDEGGGGLAGVFEVAGSLGGGGVAVIGGDGGGGLGEGADGAGEVVAGEEMAAGEEEVGEGGEGFGGAGGGGDVGECAHGDLEAMSKLDEIELVGMEHGVEDVVVKGGVEGGRGWGGGHGTSRRR